jgi:hypothetical protein
MNQDDNTWRLPSFTAPARGVWRSPAWASNVALAPITAQMGHHGLADAIPSCIWLYRVTRRESHGWLTRCTLGHAV